MSLKRVYRLTGPFFRQTTDAEGNPVRELIPKGRELSDLTKKELASLGEKAIPMAREMGEIPVLEVEDDINVQDALREGEVTKEPKKKKGKKGKKDKKGKKAKADKPAEPSVSERPSVKDKDADADTSKGKPVHCGGGWYLLPNGTKVRKGDIPAEYRDDEE